MPEKPSYEELEQRVKKLEKERTSLDETKDKLSAVEEQMRAIIRAYDGLIYVCSQDYRVEYMNDRLIERTGYNATGEKCYKVLHDCESVCPWCISERVFKGETVRWDIKSPKDDRWYHVVNTPLCKLDGTISKMAMIQDITDYKQQEEELLRHQVDLEQRITRCTADLLRKNEQLTAEIEKYAKAESDLRASEEKYRSLVENIGVGVSLISPKMEILTLNPLMREWFPLINPSEQPLCYKAFNTPPRDGICAYCPTYKTLLDGQVHEAVSETPMGDDTKNFRIISSPVKDQDGKVIAAIEMVEDVTEKNQMKERLRESEEKYRTIFETTASGTMIIEEDTTISLVNKAFVHITGYSKDEIEGKKSWTKFVHAEDLVKTKKYHYLRRVNPNAAPRRYEARVVDNRGHVKDVLVTASLISGTKISIVSFVDITEQKNIEKALQKREKELEAKSRMLQEGNTALRVLVNQRNEDKKELEEKLLTNVKELVLPYVKKIKKGHLTADQLIFLNILETNLDNIISPFLRNIIIKHLNLTPKEIQITSLIKDGKTTKEIAELLDISTRAIEFHRDNIRTKLQLKNRKTNLRSYLTTLS
ncbi:MAG: PAS domain S-box protein [Syntrophales bacterium]